MGKIESVDKWRKMYNFPKAARNTNNFCVSQSMTWLMLAVTKGPTQLGSPISPRYLMTERDPAIENMWIFYSKTIGISKILVTIVIVFLWQNILNLSYINPAIWKAE